MTFASVDVPINTYSFIHSLHSESEFQIIVFAYLNFMIYYRPTFEMLNASIDVNMFSNSMAVISVDAFYYKTRWKSSVWDRTWEYEKRLRNVKLCIDRCI